MWRVWNLAKAYHTRPSELLGVHDGLAAFHLDAAIWSFGSELDAALDEAVNPPQKGRSKVKPLSPAQQHLRTMAVLEKWLGVTGLKKYRDPAIRGKR